MSKIVQLTAENVKRLRAVQISPSGNLVVIGGNNGQGKSSLLDSIAMAIGGANEVPSMPVRRGTDKARVELDLGDIVVRRTFTLGKYGETTSSLVVENKDKMRASAPQAILDKLTGKVTFDPLAFINMDQDKQAATLKRLVGLDLSALDAQRKKLYDERTLANRDLSNATARLNGMPEHKDAPADETNVTDIIVERDAVIAHNAQRAKLEDAETSTARLQADAIAARAQLVQDITDAEIRLALLRKKLTDADAQIVERQKMADAARAARESFVAKDVGPVNAKLANVESVNAKVRANKQRAEQVAAVAIAKAKSDDLTKKIEAIDRQKDEKLAAVRFPVPGLSFDESGGVVYNGVPFDQASAAERMRVSVAIAAAMNPKLRVMLVRDASLLDEDGLAQLEKLASEFDMQVWAERVGHGAECSVIIEDGTVKGAADQTAELPGMSEQKVGAA